MGKKGRQNAKKPKRISFLGRGVKPRTERLKGVEPVKVAFLSKKEVDQCKPIVSSAKPKGK